MSKTNPYVNNTKIQKSLPRCLFKIIILKENILQNIVIQLRKKIILKILS